MSRLSGFQKLLQSADPAAAREFDLDNIFSASAGAGGDSESGDDDELDDTGIDPHEQDNEGKVEFSLTSALAGLCPILLLFGL